MVCVLSELHYFISQASNKMYIDNSQIFVDMECERTLHGWKPRRLGLLNGICTCSMYAAVKVEVLEERRNRDS